MGFPSSVVEDVLVRCGRCCCLCHKFCGVKIETDHIVQQANGGTDDADNCMPLCFDCHAEVHHYTASHPKGRKFTPAELKSHRDNWYGKVATAGGVATASSSYLEPDRKTLEQIRSKISPKYLSFLREHSFGHSFPDAALTPGEQYLATWRDVNEEFLDADLEQLRADFAHSLAEFQWELVKNIFPVESRSDWYSVPSDWEENQPEHFREIIAQLNSLASTAAGKYEELIRTARRKLSV